MDLASAVQSLLAYEASLKLAPGQKPPPASPSLFNQLTKAVRAIEQVLTIKAPETQFYNLPLSGWSDWPLCCGVDLTPRELQAVRSLPPSLLRSRGLPSLFLALHSCAVGGVSRASVLAPMALLTLTCLQTTELEDDPAPFPSAHLAARVGHRLINADNSLHFPAKDYGDDLPDMWSHFFVECHVMLSRASAGPTPARSAVPNEAAGLGLAKEMAMMLDALSASQRGPEGCGTLRGRCPHNSLPFYKSCQVLYGIMAVVHKADKQTSVDCSRWESPLYREAAALSAYDPVLLLQSYHHNLGSTADRGPFSSELWAHMLAGWRALMWAPLSYGPPRRKLRPADGYTAMRLGLEDLGRPGAGGETWTPNFIGFGIFALESGLVQPELILRARPQLLEGLVEGLAKNQTGVTPLPESTTAFIIYLAHSPAVSFHLRKFFSRSGCLQAVQKMPKTTFCQKQLIRFLGPRAAQAGTGPLYNFQAAIDNATKVIVEDPAPAVRRNAANLPFVIDCIIRDLTLDILGEPRNAQLILHFLSELAEEIAAGKPQSAHDYGVLMVVGLGKACLSFSNTVVRALKEIKGSTPKGMGGRGLGGAKASGRGLGQKALRARLVDVGRELSLLRRRVLRELLPLAEAREAAVWEGVREEEVVAALMGDA